MGFADRLKDDVNRVFFGAEVFEEDLVYVPLSIAFRGTVDIDSFNTGDGAENEVNRSMAKLCQIYAPSIIFPTTPAIYDEIYQESEDITWTVKQLKREGGMWHFYCTSGDNRRRGRIR